MIEVKRNSERETMEYQYRLWKRSNDTELYHVYGKFSRAKINAMDRCKGLMHTYGGRGLRILSHNSFSFTVGFEFPHPETGVLCFAYITPSYDRWIEVTEEMVEV